MQIRRKESIFYDFEKENGEAIGNDEGGYYEIRNELGEVVFTDALTVSNGTFQLRIKKEDTITLEVGNYQLLVAFENTVTGYSDFIFDEKLQILM